MPSRNRETAHQALEMLENYYRNLTRPEDAVLKAAIDRLTCIFKSRLFQALLDIQEFCEVVLNDSDKDVQTKVLATHAMADRWEIKSPFQSSPHEHYSDNNVDNYPAMGVRSENNSNCSTLEKSLTALNMKSSCTSLNLRYSYEDHWSIEEIIIDRPPGVGLGFSIAGGTDAPCIPNDCSIFVTRITPNGLTDRDRRLRIHDIILQVNNTSFSNISHSLAVETLKRAGDKVYLRVKRLNPPFVEEIKLHKGSRGLGFSIAGGINSEIIPGDHGVFVTQIFPDGPADVDGRLRVGDRLIMVQTIKNDFDLTFVDHVQARDFIMQASEDSDSVILIVGHASSLYNYGSGTGKSSINGDDVLRENRKIVLTKNSNGFGFNIVGGEEGEGIFVSFILTGGPADLNGKLRKGDQILSVNNIDLRYASHEEAASTLKNAGQTAVLIVRYRPNEFSRYEARVNDIREQFMEATNDMPNNGPAIVSGGGTLRTSMKRQFFVRAYFDYDAMKDSGIPGRGLNFKRGDILHVTNAADDDWWQARRIDLLSGQEEDLGIIPSKKRVERKEKARMRKVNFGKIDSKCGSLDRKKRRKFGIFGKDKKDLQSGEDTDNEQAEEAILSYVPVVQQELNYARPVVVLGPMKDRINEDLIHEHPDLFGICVPHTTRPKRDKEIDGKDYHFVASREEMERDIQNHLFIEAGQFNSNLYGTSVASVREVAEQGKKCVLDVSGHAIKRLQLAGLYPIAILIMPKSVNNILELNKRFTIDQATKLFERSQKLEQDFKEYFTGVVEGDTYDEIFDKVKDIITQNSGPTIWVQSDEKI